MLGAKARTFPAILRLQQSHVTGGFVPLSVATHPNIICRSLLAWRLSAPRARRVRWGRSPHLMWCCVDDEGFVALRRRPAGGDVKPPQAALVEDRRGER